MPTERLIPLPQLPRELTAHTGQQAPSYRRLYTLVLDGRLPATQVNGRHHVRAADVPAIVEALGLGSIAPVTA
jgi:hypothetical protein